MYRRNASESRGGEISRALEFGQNAYHQDQAKRLDKASNMDNLIKVYAQAPKKFSAIEEEEDRKYSAIIANAPKTAAVRDRRKDKETAEFQKK